ncbi:hypothetical protein PAXRUDRAFT_677004 [Paxillus rubicundulus Ve08.2h10]|uniref:Uncharacterized protein n=1 Tax=Paxillus rubicundulus Ve08.2h10 TaxID=930991 RepID=A0A0D0DHX8_9AGAM|nr:hypothetical protein PAXRUDRAFT_677004 [Paxillus rubicundulus Ve08.2h10]
MSLVRLREVPLSVAAARVVVKSVPWASLPLFPLLSWRPLRPPPVALAVRGVPMAFSAPSQLDPSLEESRQVESQPKVPESHRRVPATRKSLFLRLLLSRLPPVAPAARGAITFSAASLSDLEVKNLAENRRVVSHQRALESLAPVASLHTSRNLLLLPCCLIWWVSLAHRLIVPLANAFAFSLRCLSRTLATSSSRPSDPRQRMLIGTEDRHDTFYVAIDINAIPFCHTPCRTVCGPEYWWRGSTSYGKTTGVTSSQSPLRSSQAQPSTSQMIEISVPRI